MKQKYKGPSRMEVKSTKLSLSQDAKIITTKRKKRERIITYKDWRITSGKENKNLNYYHRRKKSENKNKSSKIRSYKLIDVIFFNNAKNIKFYSINNFSKIG